MRIRQGCGVSRVLRLVILIRAAWSAAAAAAAGEVPPQTLSPPLAARDGSQTVSPEWVLAATPPTQVLVPWELDWVGKSERLVYSFADARQAPVIEMLELRTAKRIRLGEGIAPRVSPDGHWIAYWRLGDGGRAELHAHSLHGQAPLKIARFPAIDLTEAEMAWTADSRGIAVGYRQPFERAWTRNPTDEASRSTAVDFDSPASEPSDSEIWLHELGGSPPKRLMQTPGVIHYLGWNFQGTELLYGAIRRGYESTRYETHTVLGAIELPSGTSRVLMTFDGSKDTLAPALRPDGRALALTVDLDNDPFNLMPSVAILELHGPQAGKLRRLTHDAKMARAAWSRDGKTLYASRHYGPYTQLYRIDPASGAMQQVTHFSAELCDAAIGPGDRVAVLMRDAQGRTALSVSKDRASAQSRFGRVVELNAPPSQLRLGEVREVAWRSPDGVQSRGIVFLPPDYQATRRYPLIVDLHGGLMGARVTIRSGALLYNTPFEFHMWAAKGYVVFLPEFRSSGALGLAPLQRMVTEQDTYGLHGDEQDILSGIEHLVASGLVDTRRVAVLGMSGGATETNWLVARTRNRFRAAVSVDGFAETYISSSVAAAAGGMPDFAHRVGGWPWEIPQVYLENSAIYHVRGATTPTLFLMGDMELSGADPTMSSQFLYAALKRQGVQTRYVRYAKEGHGFFRPANRRDSVLRAIEWIDRHMAP